MATYPPASAGPQRSWVLVDVALVLLALGLVVALLVTWRTAPGRTDVDDTAAAASDLQRAATTAAGAEAVAFLEVDHEDMTAVTGRVLEGATGDFAEEYAAGRDRLVRSVERREATVTASLRAVGLERVDADAAVALVAADSLLVDRDTGEDGTLRKHRLRLELERGDDRWLVTSLEFVR